MSLYDVPAVDAGAPVVAVARVTSAVGLGARWPGQVAFVRDDGSVVGSLLRGAGVDEEVIAHLRGPAGLDIGSRTPAEIAVAIVAEMLSVRASAAGGALRDRGGPINASRA